MTIADRKTSAPRRSWLSHLRAVEAPPPAPPPPSPMPPTPAADSPARRSFEWARKPHGDMADLLIMSTVDQKAPPKLAGGADLLDALVQEHLQREVPAAPAAGDDLINPPPASLALETPEAAPAPGPGLSTEDRAAMLQREIDMLLSDAPPDEPAPSLSAAPAPLPPPILEEAPAQAAGPASATAVAPAPSNEDSLVADLEHLLAQTPAEDDALPKDQQPSPPASPLAVAEVAVTPAVTNAEVAAQAPPPSPATALPQDISAQELDILLAKEPDQPTADVAAAPVAAAELPDSEAEEKLSEAEGVLAEELTKLMAETTGQPAPQAPSSASPASAAAASPPVAPEADAELAAELAKLMSQPASSEPPRATAQNPAAVASTSAPTTPVPNTPAPAINPDPAAQVASSSAEGAKDLSRPSLFWRIEMFFANILLMLAQILDLPFAWMDDLGKNAVGLAAALLLLGGIVLWALSHTALLGG